MQMKSIDWLSAVILSLGIFGAGFCIGKAFYLSKLLNSSVTVKGLTERDVKSDLGIWEIDYREIGGNLTDLNQRLEQDQKRVTDFLTSHGFTQRELDVQPIKLEDRIANGYQTTNPISPDQRYVVSGGIRVRSGNVNLIQQTNQQLGALLQMGVPLAFDISGLTPNPSFYYTVLDTIRPSMLADATRSARMIALQFAKDSGTELGAMQSANQGVFQIMARDTSTLSADWNSTQSALGSIDKKIRLVTTINYRLK